MLPELLRQVQALMEQLQEADPGPDQNVQSELLQLRAQLEQLLAQAMPQEHSQVKALHAQLRDLRAQLQQLQGEADDTMVRSVTGRAEFVMTNSTYLRCMKFRHSVAHQLQLPELTADYPKAPVTIKSQTGEFLVVYERYWNPGVRGGV